MRPPVAALLILASCTSQATSHIPSLTEQVSALLPGLKITWLDTAIAGGGPDRLRSRLAAQCVAPVDSTRSYLMGLLGRE